MAAVISFMGGTVLAAPERCQQAESPERTTETAARGRYRAIDDRLLGVGCRHSGEAVFLKMVVQLLHKDPDMLNPHLRFTVRVGDHGRFGPSAVVDPVMADLNNRAEAVRYCRHSLVHCRVFLSPTKRRDLGRCQGTCQDLEILTQKPRQEVDPYLLARARSG